jgi:hypothetical protein
LIKANKPALRPHITWLHCNAANARSDSFQRRTIPQSSAKEDQKGLIALRTKVKRHGHETL